jgi:AcrR family transcriptional regulator
VLGEQPRPDRHRLHLGQRGEVPAKPFHHGNLRQELLGRARATLRESGEEGLSLRQLAREAGVSHGAPRRHFPERQHLLNALAEQGFDELTATMVDQVDGDAVAAFAVVARSYIDFAVHDAALMDLMFSTKNHGTDPEVASAADRFFTTVGSILSVTIPPSVAPVDDRLRLQLVLVSTLHGIASLVASGRLDASQVDQMVDDTSRVFRVQPTIPV